MYKVMAISLLLGCALPFAAAQGEVASSTGDSVASVSKRLVSFYSQPLPSAGKATPIRVPAVLSLPANVTGPAPAVVILHGSAGMDSRGPLHGGDLNARGIATLELDMWGARRLAGGAQGRPPRVHDTLPDLAGALAYLATQPGIDSHRVGVLGFSWGGAQTMLAASAAINDELEQASGVRPVALAAFYPVCWGYNRVPGYNLKHLAPARLLVLVGEKDQYEDDPAACPTLVSSLPAEDQARAQVVVYPGAEHGFNGLEAAQEYKDPFLHRGQGGLGRSAPDPAAREASRKAVVGFFTDSFTTTTVSGR
ncbi:dienelactone hydrolase family protein [Pseudomonas sp. zfem002]|uniref:dienelactone hydrolase family protein n=1 Tax=Pseudomonas sp. zfem002 TaxID=3078197 RepID=UPI0029293627|nr:dienelactone hydrolase family protein [Pseudomonas sp. zfem002]MDU9393395.1 dienelactone hydrolase family protein [Pseudomonas sp. zfem002]